MELEIEHWKAKPQNEELKKAKHYRMMKMDQDLRKNINFWWKSVANQSKNTKIVSFDPNPEFWSTEKNRVKKAKPWTPNPKIMQQTPNPAPKIVSKDQNPELAPNPKIMSQNPNPELAQNQKNMFFNDFLFKFCIFHQ